MGCGRMVAEKGVADCNYEAAKVTVEAGQKYSIISACMESKGYKRKEENCYYDYSAIYPGCWQRTWRIILP